MANNFGPFGRFNPRPNAVRRHAPRMPAGIARRGASLGAPRRAPGAVGPRRLSPFPPARATAEARRAARSGLFVAFYDQGLSPRLRALCATKPPSPADLAAYIALVERATGAGGRGHIVGLGPILGSLANGPCGLDDAAYERVAAAAQRLHDALHARGQGDPAMAALIGRHPRAWDRWL